MTLLAAVSTAVAVALIARGVPWRRRTVKPGNDSPLGLEVTRLQFWLVSLGAGAATFVTVTALTGLVVVASIPALVVATLPRAYYARKRSRRVALVQEAWPDGLRDIVASVRSGSSLASSLEDLGRFGPVPLRDVFANFPVYSRSLGVVPALELVRSDLSDPTSDRVVEVLILAHERGGAVVPEILSDLAEATTRDVWTIEQIRSEALEQKINSRVVFVLPWFVLIVMTMRSGPFREFYSTTTGIVVVVFCGLLSLAGMVIASKIGSQPEEARVFTGTGSR